MCNGIEPIRTRSQRECAEAVEEVAVLCPWMDAEDVERLRRVFEAQFCMVVGEAVDLGVIVGEVMVLARRAQEVGDRRQWVFDEWYRWACGVLRGEACCGPDLPAVLVALSGGVERV